MGRPKEQDLVLNAVQGIGEANGWIVVQNQDYANTGVLRFLAKNLDPAYTVRYAFQTTYYSLELRKGGGSERDDLIFKRGTAAGHTTSEIIQLLNKSVRPG